MPNEASCTITISGPPNKVKQVETFLRGLSLFEMTEEEKDLLLTSRNHTKFCVTTAWKPPKFTFIQKAISTSAKDEDYFDDLLIRCAWTELGMLGYGWWQWDGHLETHRFFNAEQEDEGGELVPTGKYAEFLKREEVNG